MCSIKLNRTLFTGLSIPMYLDFHFHLKCSRKLWSQSDDAHIFKTYLKHATVDNPINVKNGIYGTATATTTTSRVIWH